MVKSTNLKKLDSSSNPDENFKFSHSIYLKTEKIIKFAKALQDFIILQHKEILDYCVQEDEKQKETETNTINEIPIKRRVGRPRRNFNTEINNINNGKVKKVPRLIRAGVDNEGKPLYKMAPYYTEGNPDYDNDNNSVVSAKSIPSDLIKQMDDYIINEDKNHQRSIEEYEEIP